MNRAPEFHLCPRPLQAPSMRGCSSTGCAACYTCVLNTLCMQRMHTTQVVAGDCTSNFRSWPRRGRIEQALAGATHRGGGHVPKMVLHQVLQTNDDHGAQRERQL